MSKVSVLVSSIKKAFINLAQYKNIIVTLKIYLLLISIFTFFRIILFATNFENIRKEDGSIEWANSILAFIMGIRFDIVVSGYILLLFFIALTFIELFNKNRKIFQYLLFYYLLISVTLAFILSAADIPYFKQFYSRININALQWIDSPFFIIKMIIQEPRYYLIAIPLIIVIIIFYKILKKIFLIFNKNSGSQPKVFLHLLFSALFLLLMLIGIRGRVEIKSPIRIGTAYFCNNSFLNQAGLNPVFTFITSYLDKINPHNKYLNLMNEESALKIVQEHFNIKRQEFDSPIARYIHVTQKVSAKPNIVIVIMENMSAAKMGRYGNKDQLTPNLDSLALKGLCFDNIYTAGIHTFNGVYSTLFSYPALASQHPMKASSMLRYNGIAYTLKEFGYQTIYFTTHDGQFDNIEGFLYHNSFDKVYTKSDYPEEKVLSTLGVPDDFLFDFVNLKLDDYHLKNKPFLSVIMTASDHGPYIIPDYFKPKPNDITKQIVEYADWSIGKFISDAKNKKWFDNTIFVFIADHGTAISPVYEMPLNYHHSPLIFYAPKIITESMAYSKIGGQIDVFPTIMGLLKFSYINNTLGIDLLKESRPFIYFSADDKVGVLNDSLFLIINGEGKESLYKYKNSDKQNYIEHFTGLAKKMKDYTKSNLQTAQYLIKKNKQFIKAKEISNSN
ncbi:MAG: LTA synthase family protein [Ignavibacteriaceae bacterium]|nr:LTA synthase family protein [Ignavibacteriaceae bacterium]